MSNAALVAINIWYNDDHGKMLLLNDGTPILYYWNMNQELQVAKEFMHNEMVVKLIKEKVTTLEIYSKAKVSYVYYKISGTKESFTEEHISLQECLSLTEINGLVDKALDTIAKDAYYQVFHAEYIERNDDPIIYDVYAKSNLINKEQLSIDTFLNYIRSLASRKYSLSNKNIEKLYARAAETIDKSQKYHEHIG